MLRRLITTLAIGTVAVVMGASSALAATNASFVSVNLGYADMYNGAPAGNYTFSIDGQNVTAYCGDVLRALNGSASFTVVPAASSGVNNAGTAGWIAKNHSGVGTPLADAASEAAATQIAIWSYTNGISIDASTVPDNDVRPRAIELRDAASGHSLASAPTAYEVSLTSTATDASVTFTATVTADGAPVAGETVSFSVNGNATDVPTDAAGVASLTVNGSPNDSFDATATVNATIHAGSVLKASDGSQPMIIAKDVDIVAAAELTTAVLPAATTTTTAPAPTTTAPAPTTTAPVAAPTTSAPANALPYTGEDGSADTYLIVGLLLLGLVGTTTIWLRRKTA